MTHKPRTRMWQRVFILGFLFQIFCISASVHAENCPDNIRDIPTHEYLLKGASLAKLSYKTPGMHIENISYQCPQGDNQSYDVFQQPVTLHDIEQHLSSHAEACVEGTRKNGCVKKVGQDSEREVAKTVLNRRVGSNRLKETHYRCTENNADLNNLTMTIQWVDAHDELSLLIRIGVVGASAIEYTEDLRLVQLDSGDWEEKRWMGIKGTDPFSSKSFLTTILALQGRSCLFDFALEVAASFFKEKCKNHRQPTYFRGSIVGHSLGGMASEYIAIEGGIGFAMEHCKANDESIRVLSYNSIGWNSGVDGDIPRNRKRQIYSIRINGEILEEKFSGRQYLGHLVRYNAPENDCGSLCKHKISTVQRSICTCQFCKGMEYSYRGP